MKNGAWFPYLLTALLLISVGSNIYLVIRATNDPSFAVEPDYYQKAVGWDDKQAAQAQSDALGWQVELDAELQGLTVHLRDRLGRPIADAEVRVEAFHNARAQERIRGQLVSQGDGTYVWERDFARPGIWEYRLAAQRDDDRFVHVAQEELVP